MIFVFIVFTYAITCKK